MRRTRPTPWKLGKRGYDPDDRADELRRRFERVSRKGIRGRKGRNLWRLVGFLLVGAGVVAAAAFDSQTLFGTSPLSVAASDCTIKGNISIDTGERIYHVPGQRYYDATRISPKYGERWFCSEAEARQAGWRKSRL